MSKSYYYEVQLANLHRRSEGAVYTEAEAEILFVKVLKEKGLYNPFSEGLSTSNQKLVRELVKTYAINMSNMTDSKIKSIWLKTTDNIKEAASLVRFYDYSINRLKSPILSLKYIGATTKIIKRGDVLGHLGALQLVSMEDTVYLEYGDVKEFKLGYFKSIDVSLPTSTIEGKLQVDLEPTIGLGISNDDIYITYLIGADKKIAPITRHITKYITGGDMGGYVRDFSIDDKSTELHIMDSVIKAGVYSELEGVTSLKIEYLESDGVLADNLEVNINTIRFESTFLDSFEIANMTYRGYDGDTVETIKRNAPLVSTTKGFAVSLSDYKILTSAIPEIYTTSPFKEMGEGASKTFKVQDVSNIFMFHVESTPYTCNSFNTATFEILKREVESTHKEYTLEMIGADQLKITTSAYRFVNQATSMDSNLLLVLADTGIEPQCCTLMIPYVKKSYKEGLTLNKVLTLLEKQEVEKSTLGFKSWGVTTMFYPAKEEVINLVVEVQPSPSVTDTNLLIEEIKKVAETYNFEINGELPVPELLARIANLHLFSEETGSTPAIISLSTPKGVEDNKVWRVGKDSYIKVNLEVKITRWNRY